MSLWEFLRAVFLAEYSIRDMAVGFADFYAGLWTDFNISELVSGMWWHLRYVKPFLPFILFVLYIVVSCVGNKMFGFLRFCVFFITGFIIGVYTLSPLVLDVMPKLPTWVIGLITGIVSGVLSKVLYAIFLTSLLSYSTYSVLYSCVKFVFPAISRGLISLSLISIGAVIVFMLFFTKYIEMGVTALLGGYGMACIFRGWYDYTSLGMFVGREWLGVLILTLVFALIGFIVQFKNREVYV